RNLPTAMDGMVAAPGPRTPRQQPDRSSASGAIAEARSVTTTPTAAGAAASPRTATATAVAAVVVHYRGAHDTLACVESLRAQGEALRIVVIDNASADDSHRELAAAFAQASDVSLLRTEKNGGFGAGANLGITRALATPDKLRSVLLLNPDARLRPGALAALRAC